MNRSSCMCFRNFAILAVASALVLGFAVSSNAATSSATVISVLQGVHGDRSQMPKTCRSCHRGMNVAIDGEEAPCLDCHGAWEKRELMLRNGYLTSSAPFGHKNIEAELRKPYNHPVLTKKLIHQRNELLPEDMTNAARHAECSDCHNPHLVEADNPFRGITGRRVINLVTEIEHEYELCYKCHSSSANLPVFASDKAAEFRTTNPSFHPVEAEGKLAYVVSLKKPYSARKEQPGDISTISCSDCHGSDNAEAPKGPHGSNFRGLLSLKYEMEDGRPESSYSYALCYKCHDRASILANDSFAYHRQHIEGNRASRQPGTSCYSCHDAHGSSVNPYLIRFNEDVVRPNTAGKLEFKAQGVATRHGSCSLSCHGVEHDARSY